VKAGKQEIRRATQASKATIQGWSDLSGCKENRIREAALDMAMAELFWIQLRGTGREELNIEFRMLG